MEEQIAQILQVYGIVPTITAEEAMVFNINTLQNFTEVILNISRRCRRRSSLTKELSDFIEIAIMKILSSYERTEQTDESKIAIVNLVKQFHSKKMEEYDANVNRPFFSQASIEANPYYIIYVSMFSNSLFSPVSHYKNVYDSVNRLYEDHLDLVVSAGAMLLLSLYCQRINSHIPSWEESFEHLVLKIVGQNSPLKYSEWFLEMLQKFGYVYWPNIEICSGVVVFIIRAYFKAGYYYIANSIVESWLPMWSQSKIMEQLLEGMPKGEEVSTESMVEGYKSIMNTIISYMTSSFMELDIGTYDYCTVPIIKCSLSILPFLIKQLYSILNQPITSDFCLNELVELENEISDVFLTLTQRINGQGMKLELLLSAFSVRPCFPTFRLIREHIGQLSPDFSELLSYNTNYDILLRENMTIPEPEFNDLIAVMSQVRHTFFTNISTHTFINVCWKVLWTDKRRKTLLNRGFNASVSSQPESLSAWYAEGCPIEPMQQQ